MLELSLALAKTPNFISFTNETWCCEHYSPPPPAKTLLKFVGLNFQVDSRQQSAYKFLRVLEGLREWELHSPDIAAAVEFCRGKIVSMSVEEYDQWFGERFSSVSRPGSLQMFFFPVDVGGKKVTARAFTSIPGHSTPYGPHPVLKAPAKRPGLVLTIVSVCVVTATCWLDSDVSVT